MINSVRQTVLAIANKHQFGYITPADFNLYAKQAQLDIFEDYFYRYNQWVVRQNQRNSGTGYADILKNLEEVIDNFSVESPMNNQGNTYTLPNDYYLINKVVVKTNLLSTGTSTSETSNTLTQSDATFVSQGVFPGDLISVLKDGVVYDTLVSNVTETTITTPLGFNWNEDSSLQFAVYRSNNFKESEKLSHTKITMLNSSNLTSPDLTFPVHTQSSNVITSHPEAISNIGQLKAQYIRKPKDPNWTYVSVGGNAMYDIGNINHQDLEIPATDEPLIISKILKYIGISIREADVYNAAEKAETKEQQKQG